MTLFLLRFEKLFIITLYFYFSGNGSIQVFHVLKGKFALAPSLLINHHSSTGINALSFLGNNDNSNKPYILASGGNDMELNIWQVPPIEMNSKGKQMIPNNEVILENDQVEKIRLFKSTFETKISTLEKISHNSKSLLLIGDQTSSIKLLDVSPFIASYQ